MHGMWYTRAEKGPTKCQYPEALPIEWDCEGCQAHSQEPEAQTFEPGICRHERVESRVGASRARSGAQDARKPRLPSADGTDAYVECGLVSTSTAELRSPETLATVRFSHVSVKNHAKTWTGATFGQKGPPESTGANRCRQAPPRHLLEGPLQRASRGLPGAPRGHPEDSHGPPEGHSRALEGSPRGFNRTS